MKKYLYIMLSMVLAGVFASCSKDEPFGGDAASATGGLLTSALDISLNSEYGPRSVKARGVRAAAPSIDNFKVSFFAEGADEAYITYDYKDMPEIVTLPVGKYYAVAFYGTDPIADWDSPYYKGRSNVFEIFQDDITDKVDKIVCAISNVRVSVSFSTELKAAIDGNCEVIVEVGDEGKLTFTQADIEAGRSGYFRYIENSNTLAVTFKGNVDGVYTEETKTGVDVEPGRYYSITFNLHDAGAEDPGNIGRPDDDNGFIRIDASFSSENIEWTADFEDSIIEDDLRPKEEVDDPGKEDPEPDDPNVPDNPGAKAPVVTAQAPIDIDKVNKLTEESTVVLNIKSEAEGGIQEFIVDIVSNVLTAEELGDMLPTTLDIANTPEDYREKLEGLGFPTNVKGEKDVEFTITNFIPVLLAISADKQAYYNFVLKVRDANGYTEKTLKLTNY